jgi:hypothetical protein
VNQNGSSRIDKPCYQTINAFFYMVKAHIKAHTFVGEAGTKATNGFAGFQLHHRYELRYSRGDEGVVLIELDHLPHGGQLVVNAAEFERWFVK